MVLTENGFKRPTFDELLNRQINRAKQMWGEDIDTSEQTALGKFLRINVYDLAECYELLEDIYYARFPNSARGQSLDRLCTFAGVARNPATAARIKILLMGKAGAAIEAGTVIVAGNTSFYLDNDYVIGANGTCEAYANCCAFGSAGNILSGVELVIEKPLSDLTSVTFLEIVQLGKDRETDTSLRIRFAQSIAGAGSASVDAIRGALSRIAFVDGVAVIENDTEETIEGRPPHSFECYVLAPESQDQLVAQAIFSKKPLGIKSVGSVEVPVADEGGKLHAIRFSRTLKKSIAVRLKVMTNQFFESGGTEQIKASLMEYINNLSNGESVYLSSLYGCIHDVHGVVNVQSLELSGDGEMYLTGNIILNDHEVARVSAEDIEIEVVT